LVEFLYNLSHILDYSPRFEKIKAGIWDPWFDEGCSELLDERKQARLQWLQDQSEINGDNLNNKRRETSRHFRNKKRQYLKDKIDELATNSKNKNIRDTPCKNRKLETRSCDYATVNKVVYSLCQTELCRAWQSRASPLASLVATQRRGKHISAAVSQHATIGIT
jgi:uncharacterized protein YaaR (DUF327 family)